MAYLKLSDQTNLHYQVTGQGKALLLLRGLARSRRYWLGFDAKLAKKFKVITVDLRGMGKTEGEVSFGLTMEHYANDLMTLMTHLKIAEYFVIGHSLGGMVALSLADLDKKRVKGLVVINTSIRAGLGIRLNPLAFLKMSQSLVKGQSFQEALCSLLAPESAKQKARIVSSWQKIAEDEGLRVMAALKQLLAANRFSLPKSLKKAHPPLWIIVGENDHLVPPSNSLRLVKMLPKARLIWLKGGHELPLDQEEELIALIEEMVS